MNEFDAIQDYFAKLTEGRAEAQNLKDDAAILDIPDNQELVISSDTLNAGTHFLAEAKPDEIAHKALRTNLSDLAAMGAQPYAYQLSIALPDKPDKDWLETFTNALLEDQKEFGIFCSGGDTTSIKGPLSISITAMGLVKKGEAITRSGAKDSDTIILTGPVGDAFIGLHLLSFLSPHPDLFPEKEGKTFGEGSEGYFIERYYKPQPRTDLLELIRAHAHAAIDISDGLVADLGHICKASNLAADVTVNKDLFSGPAQAMIDQNIVTPEELISAGDDYQLLLAVPADNAPMFLGQVSGSLQIGQFKTGEPNVNLFDEESKPIDMKHTGWSHF